MSNAIDIALQIAVKAHEGQKDKDGNPVILHPITVGMMGNTDEEKIAGFLHDVVEDTSYTFDDLVEKGIPVSIVQALRLLTHEEGVDYYDYVQRIIDSQNPIALQVKYNDLRHNYARGKAYPLLQKKHGKALEMVKAAIESCSQISLYEKPNYDHPVDIALFAGGCFWGVQHHFGKLKGVVRTLVGYTGGEEKSPTYQEVRSHLTHHVEAVLVEYDATEVSYTELCKLFFEIHDPAQTDGQGEDIGQQYRSCVFYDNQQQQSITEALIEQLRSNGYEINTLVLPLSEFWIGEEYHQRYYEKTGGEPYCHTRIRKFKD